MPTLRALLASLVFLLVGGAVFSAATDGFQSFTTEAARRLAVQRHPARIPAAALQTQSGAHIQLSDFRGKWLVIDFIYTRCPSYCIALGGEFAQLQDRLAGPIAQGKVQLLSISFDPDHDTPSQLAAYLAHSRDRGHGWLAARPIDPDGLAQIKRVFGVTVIADGQGGYTHNAAVHLVDPRGRLVGIFDLGDPGSVERAVLQRLGQ
ncbi:SCO family protein [Polaromonas sp. C04]|uniref:SCO family protein n=1 Tax=Polaromonas sp. C04 TaxID=1945857 RepID=UPI000984BCE0|nr:SCO family protein [Polaromonas sp. C04]OOG51990.1 electron transporter SenC [Polaromonas sp. C04]